jgi:hypothetical protein
MLAALDAAAGVSAATGPYNPQAIAARALAELASLSPSYLAALVAHLGELAPLLVLPPPPEGAAPRGGSTRRPKPRAKR